MIESDGIHLLDILFFVLTPVRRHCTPVSMTTTKSTFKHKKRIFSVTDLRLVNTFFDNNDAES
jgi:hypothetical protein